MIDLHQPDQPSIISIQLSIKPPIYHSSYILLHQNASIHFNPISFGILFLNHDNLLHPLFLLPIYFPTSILPPQTLDDSSHFLQFEMVLGSDSFEHL